jgi:flagellar biosynthetic protein FliQ
MNDTTVLQIGMDAMMVAAKIAAPTLLTALFVGVAIGLVQSATQLQEQTVAFVPKFIGVGIAMIVSGNWMLSTMIDFTHQLWGNVPTYLS